MTLAMTQAWDDTDRAARPARSRLPATLGVALALHAAAFALLPSGERASATEAVRVLSVRMMNAVSAAPAAPPPRTSQPESPREPAVVPRSAQAAPAVETPTVAEAAPLPVAAPATRATETAQPAEIAAAPVRTLAHVKADYGVIPKPSYPALSQRLGEEGVVLLRVRVSAVGTPLSVEIERSSGFTRLDAAARRAAAGWTFVPERRGDEYVESTVVIPLTFSLDS